MNIELGDTGVSLGEVADGAKAASALTKSLPGMAKSDDEGSAEPGKSDSDQKIVTTQPEDAIKAAEDLAGKAEDLAGKADEAADCFNKLCDCFGKGLDNVDKVQQMTGQQ